MNRPAISLRLATMGLILLAACGRNPEAGEAPVGDAERGAATVQRYGCGACHKIPGIPGAIGIVGPSLAKMAERGYVGGVLANTPENLIRWLLDPPRVDPTTAMPAMGLSEAEARDIAAYLYTLK